MFISQRVRYQFNKNYCITSSIQKSAQFINSFLQCNRFYGLIESTFSFPEFVTAWKTSLIPSVHFLDNVRVPWPDWPHPFLTLLIPKIFNHLLICAKFYRHAKNQSTPSIHSWDLEILLILESRDEIGHTYFWPCPTKTFRSTFNFCEFVSTCWK